MRVFTFVGPFVGNGGGAIVRGAPNADDGDDALLDVSQRIDHLAGSLAGQVLKRAGGENGRDVGFETVTQVAGGAAFAELPRQLHQMLGSIENLKRSTLGRNNNGVEFVGGRYDPVVVGIRRL